MGRRTRNSNLTPMSIQSSLTSEPRSSKLIDGSLIICAIVTLFALLLVLDAYEYIVVPGASKVNGRQAPMTVPISTKSNVTTTVDVPDAKTADLQMEIKRAQQYIMQKRQELENMSVVQVETIAEEDGIDDTNLKADEELLETQQDEDEATIAQVTIEEQIAVKEKIQEEKEEIIEEIVEKELGIDDWCPKCIWLGVSGYSCTDRLWWIKKYYKVKEDDAGKKALLKDGCNKTDGKVGVWEKDDSGKLLGKEATL